MKTTSLIYLFNPQGQVLLGAKKKTNRQFTAAIGKRNGAGGKINEGETLLQSVVRELEEETGIKLPEEAFTHLGINKLYYENKPDRDQEAHVFVTKDFVWDPQDSDELILKWFDIKDIPYENMRDDDIYRMPRMLAGEYFEYIFHFSEEGKIKSHELIK